MGKDLEGENYSIMKVFSQCFSERKQEIVREYSVRKTAVPSEIRTNILQNSSLEQKLYTDFLVREF
jgi:hypothetical protein